MRCKKSGTKIHYATTQDAVDILTVSESNGLLNIQIRYAMGDRNKSNYGYSAAGMVIKKKVSINNY